MVNTPTIPQGLEGSVSLGLTPKYRRVKRWRQKLNFDYKEYRGGYSDKVEDLGIHKYHLVLVVESWGKSSQLYYLQIL